MRDQLHRRWRSFPRLLTNVQHVLITNASSLVGTTAVTSALGFAYWWLAAQQFSLPAVGFASAAISAMLLLGTMAELGLGTLLIGELPRQSTNGPVIAIAAVGASGIIGMLFGCGFALVAPLISVELQPLAGSTLNVATFALGTGLTAATLVLDQALIGLLRGSAQFWRNVVFAVAKLVALFMVGMWSANQLGFDIYGTWLVGNIVSLLGLGWMLRRSAKRVRISRTEWQALWHLRRAALAHHALNLALKMSNLALPLLVTAVLSASMNASFYIAWMIAGFVFVGPIALTTVLYAVGTGDSATLRQTLRFTLGLSAIIGVAANIVLLPTADLVLHIFGPLYAEQAALTLQLLGFGVFPLIIKDHYVALGRIHGRIGRTASWVALGGMLELLLAALGAHLAGLPGLTVGWLCALCIQALCMVSTVRRAASTAPVDATAQPATVDTSVEHQATVQPVSAQRPLVSIIINNYNYGRFVAAAIDSALHQTWPHVEIIVVDDGSTDHSHTVIAAYADQVTTIYKQNGGQASAFNVGFTASRGDIIIFLDADDILLPDTTQRVVAAFAATPGVAKVQYRMEVIDVNGARTGIVKPPAHVPLLSGDLRQQYLMFPDDVVRMATSGNAFATWMLKRIFPVPESVYLLGADTYLCHLSPLFGLVKSLDDVGTLYRVHGANNYEVMQFSLVWVHRNITHSVNTHDYIAEHARQLGLMPTQRMHTINSVSLQANKLISLKLDPERHPIAGDRIGQVAVSGISVALRRFDVPWLMRGLYVAWFIALALAPRRQALWLAERLIFAGRRKQFNKVLGWLYRRQVTTPGGMSVQEQTEPSNAREAAGDAESLDVLSPVGGR